MLEDGTPKRPWYDDALYCQLFEKDPPPYSFQSEVFEEVDRHLKTPYSLDLLSKKWRSSLNSNDIDSLHVLHLGRQLGALQGAFSK